MSKFVWSYSSLNCYLSVCPHQFVERYIHRNVPFKETPEIHYGNIVHKQMEIYINHRKGQLTDNELHFVQPLIDYGAVAEGELGIDINGRTCSFWSMDVWGRGKIDVSVVRNGSAYIADWKTGNSKYESPFELEIQALLLKAKYPHVQTIRGQYVWLKENRLGQMYDLSDVEETWQKCTLTAREIEGKRAVNDFPKRPGPLCGWCPVTSCEHNRAKS